MSLFLIDRNVEVDSFSVPSLYTYTDVQLFDDEEGQFHPTNSAPPVKWSDELQVPKNPRVSLIDGISSIDDRSANAESKLG